MSNIMLRFGFSTIKSILKAYRMNKNYYKVGCFARDACKNNNLPSLNETDIKEIDDFWKQFGIRFRDYSYHQMYYSVTGMRDPRFIPDPLAGLVIYPYYNDMSRVKAYADKNLFSKFLPDIHFPRMFAQRINKHFYDSNHVYYGTTFSDKLLFKVFSEIEVNSISNIIIKETTDTNTGKGVKKYTIDSPDTLRNAIISNNSYNFIIQECIRQHTFFEQFNPDSVNIIRLNTWRTDGDIKLFSPCIRFGIPGSPTDVNYLGGKEIINCIGIHNGLVADHYYTLDGKKLPLLLKEKVVPKWDEIVETVKKGHLEMDYFGIIAWDVIVDQMNRIVCVEYNLKWPGTIVYQFAHGPFAGVYTEEYLSFLKDPSLQKLCPRSIQL